MELNRLTDEELVRLSREGNSEVTDFLMEKYKPLVLRFSRARFLAGGDRDDLIQEGMIGLYKAVRDYDAERAASFATFAALCIDRQILSAIDASRREKNRPLNNSVNLTDEEWENALTAVRESPEKIVIEREESGERLAKLREVLSPLERKVLRLYLSGRGYREIAGLLGRTPKQIDNAIQRIRKKTQAIRS